MEEKLEELRQAVAHVDGALRSEAARWLRDIALTTPKPKDDDLFRL